MVLALWSFRAIFLGTRRTSWSVWLRRHLRRGDMPTSSSTILSSKGTNSNNLTLPFDYSCIAGFISNAEFKYFNSHVIQPDCQIIQHRWVQARLWSWHSHILPKAQHNSTAIIKCIFKGWNCVPEDTACNKFRKPNWADDIASESTNCEAQRRECQFEFDTEYPRATNWSNEATNICKKWGVLQTGATNGATDSH